MSKGRESLSSVERCFIPSPTKKFGRSTAFRFKGEAMDNVRIILIYIKSKFTFMDLHLGFCAEMAKL